MPRDHSKIRRTGIAHHPGQPWGKPTRSSGAHHIVELLSEDMVSHGLLSQTIQEVDRQSDWKSVLAELLSGDVEIGEAKLASPDYVEFIAWKGTIGERVSRAEERVRSLAAQDQEFAYWLALRRNVDRLEGVA